MTPETIRRQETRSSNTTPRDAFYMLRELTAQLAEINQHLKTIADTMYAEGMAKHGQ